MESSFVASFLEYLAVSEAHSLAYHDTILANKLWICGLFKRDHSKELSSLYFSFNFLIMLAHFSGIEETSSPKFSFSYVLFIASFFSLLTSRSSLLSQFSTLENFGELVLTSVSWLEYLLSLLLPKDSII